MARGLDGFEIPDTNEPTDSATPSVLERVKRGLYGVYCYFTFSHVAALLDEGAAGSLGLNSAKKFYPKDPSLKQLGDGFHKLYGAIKARGHPGGSFDVARALLQQQRGPLAMQVVWVTIETIVRFSTPYFLREFLIWLGQYKDDNADLAEGWLWALLLSVGPFMYVLCHGRLFYTALLTGYRMRVTLSAALHSKLLRLNSSSVARVTTGHIVNLASTDLARFDMGLIFWPYLIFGPVESVLVLVLVALVLGFVPAIAGMSSLFILIPMQASLSKFIGNCRRKTAIISDKRLNLTGELISGNLAVKMLGWEDALIKDVTALRDREHKLLTQKAYVRSSNVSLPNVTQALIVCVTFITYRFTEGDFNVPDVFFAVSLMMLPRMSLAAFFVLAVEFVTEMGVSCRRVDTFLKIPEPKNTVRADKTGKQGEVEIRGGKYGWYGERDEKKKQKPRNTLLKVLSKMKSRKTEGDSPPQLRQTLNDIDLSIRPGELVGIAGRVGSGKSSLLAALLDDMENLTESQSVRMNGNVSFCSQTPWIVAGTVRENILFGQPFDEELHERVVSSCALNTDFDQFPSGDSTELGERGINISGGQKARIALARAAYSRADVHLLDDPLSAVDPRVGRILFDCCIGPEGVMHSSTRLLVTHQRQFLPLCNRIVLMANGRIEAVGTWKELSGHEILKTLETDKTHEAVSLDAADQEIGKKGLKTGSASDSSSSIHQMTQSKSVPLLAPKEEESRKDQLVQAESKELGKVALKVYWSYIRFVGLTPMLIGFFIASVSRILYMLATWWVGSWAAADDDEQDDMKWVWILSGLTVGGILTNLIGVFALFAMFITGSTRLHNKMLETVMHAPLKFFHTNPAGRILNRFAKDVNLQDEMLSMIATDLLTNLIVVLGTFVLVCLALPYMVIFFVIVAWVFWRIRRRYVTTSREIKRFDGVTRSPVYAMLSANIKGLSTIRAYGSEQEFQDRFIDAVEMNGSWWMSSVLTGRWVAFRMDAISAFIMLASAVCAVLLGKEVSTEVLGLALTYVTALSGSLQFVMRQSAEFENAMTSVERTLEYTELEQEPPTAAQGGGEAPDAWPTVGSLEYVSMTASYRPGLDPVLKDLSFTIPGGSSVGIVGRTGSGKSSLLLSLFRLIDIDQGEIRLDGVNTADIGVDVLRKQLAVIPQDPVLFGGTLRSNLDPWNQQSDAKIWDVLQKVCLDSAANEVGGLDARIAECGGNLSVGQRQLLCLARSLLSDAKILALDEATANVDRTTDELIQKSLHSLLTDDDKTLLIIAHRIDTVMDCDLLLVLENGEMAEFGSPTELMSRQGGVFAGMVEAAKKATRPMKL